MASPGSNVVRNGSPRSETSAAQHVADPELHSGERTWWQVVCDRDYQARTDFTYRDRAAPVSLVRILLRQRQLHTR
jgi:hypothetical protein